MNVGYGLKGKVPLRESMQSTETVKNIATKNSSKVEEWLVRFLVAQTIETFS